MIYTHVLNRGGLGVRSPADGCRGLGTVEGESGGMHPDGGWLAAKRSAGLWQMVGDHRRSRPRGSGERLPFNPG